MIQIWATPALLNVELFELLLQQLPVYWPRVGAGDVDEPGSPRPAWLNQEVRHEFYCLHALDLMHIWVLHWCGHQRTCSLHQVRPPISEGKKIVCLQLQKEEINKLIFWTFLQNIYKLNTTFWLNSGVGRSFLPLKCSQMKFLVYMRG